ncbi:MAG: hypothetical protein ABIZ52_06050, partial [Candidatus Limnocylindrales bacterium]
MNRHSSPPKALLVVALLIAACGSSTPSVAPGDSGRPSTDARRATFPPAPDPGVGQLDPEVAIAVDDLITSFLGDGLARAPLDIVAGSRDARLAWLLADVLRFLQGSDRQDDLVEAFQRLTGVNPRTDPAFGNRAWTSLTDLLIAWDLPAPPGYR